MFESAANIRLDSPVRIAGVEVGKVTKVEHMDDSNLRRRDDGGRRTTGLPIHKDATVKIRPRLFLEGNFFVDMTAGTPGAPTIDDGDTIPVTQTAYPVQLDQILTSLQADTRKDLQNLLEGFGTGLIYQPTAAEDLGQDPDVEGESGAQALNDSLAYAPERASRTPRAFRTRSWGREPHDLRKLIAGLQKTLGGLEPERGAAQGLLHELQPHDGRARLGAGQPARGGAACSGPTLENAHSYFGNFAEALPPTAAFVREFIPGVKETPATIDGGGPVASTQFTALVSQGRAGRPAG